MTANSPESGWEPSSAELARQAAGGLARPFDPQIGTAYAVNLRSESFGRESGSITVLTFRLRRIDPSGRELPPTEVEMRGRILKGTVAEGDQIRLPAPTAGGGLQLKQVQNLTTGARVEVRSTAVPIPVSIAVGVVVLLVFLGVFAFIAYGMMTQFGSGF